jgi:hypothetical protein
MQIRARALHWPAVVAHPAWAFGRGFFIYRPMTNRFTLEAATESGTLIFPAGIRAKAVAIFSSGIKADDFVRGYFAAELRPVELTSDRLPEWLANVQCYGVTHAFLDPPARCDLRHSKAITLAGVLNEALGDKVQVVDNQ